MKKTLFEGTNRQVQNLIVKNANVVVSQNFEK